MTGETNEIGRPARRLRQALLAGAAVAAMAAWTPQARAQVTGSGGGVLADPTIVTPGVAINRSPGRDDVTVPIAEAIIDWNADIGQSAAPGDVYNFLPDGNALAFTSGTGGNNYIVLNRFYAPTADAAARFDGAVTSMIRNPSTGQSTTGGTVWFYSPGGIIVGSTGRFDVGSLLLTANEVQTFDTDGDGTEDTLFGPDGEIQLRAPVADTRAAVSIEAGAAIDALMAGSYVAMVAPRVAMAGDVQVDGSAAYVAAEDVDMTINNGLFDISVLTGSFADITGGPAGDGVVLSHTGTTGGPSSAGAGDNHRTYLVAIPKNDAVTMLVSGGVGYEAASGAGVENGVIYLSAGEAVDGDFLQAEGRAIAGPSDRDGAILIDGLRSSSRLQAVATQAILVQSASGQNVNLAADVALYAGDSVDIFAEADSAIGFGGITDIAANDGLGGRFQLFADAGSTVDFAGDVTIDVVDISDSANATGAGGFAELSLTGAAITVGGALSIRARGFGDDTGNFGRGQGGDVLLSMNGGSSLDVAGAFTISASGAGSTDFAAAHDGTGGFIGVSLIESSISAQQATFEAFGRGGDGGAAIAGTGRGGSVDISVGDAAGFDFAGLLEVNASSEGGDAFGGQDGGIADGAAAAASLAVQGGAINAGEIRVAAGAVGGYGANGGDATGGFAALSVNTGSIAANQLIVSADAVGGSAGTAGVEAGGDGGFGGGGVAVAIVSGGSVSGDAMVMSATGAGGAGGDSDTNGIAGGAGGDGVGGNARLRQDGGDILLGNLVQLDAGGFGGAGGSQTGDNGGNGGAGGSGSGGAVIVDSSAGALDAAVFNVLATGIGGAGGQGSASGASLGGDGTGGVAALTLANSDAPIALDSIQVNSFAFGGLGGSGSGTGGAGGSAQGGNSRMVVDAGDISSFDVSIGSTAFGSIGGNNGIVNAQGGDATGGTSELTLNGGSLTSGFVTLSSNPDAPGSGITQGGTARVSALGGDLTADNLRLDADARQTPFNFGPIATGGNAELIVDNGSTVALGQGSLSANAWGASLAPDGVPSVSQAGNASATILNGALVVSETFRLDAQGIGDLFSVAGGTGIGGVASVDVGEQGSIQSAELQILSVGQGGGVGLDGAIARAGDGVGGEARLAVRGGTVTVGRVNVASFAFGGGGTNPGDTAGDALGGTASVTVDSSGGTIATNSLNVDAGALGLATGGDGGNVRGGSASVSLLGGSAGLSPDDGAPELTVTASATGGFGGASADGVNGGAGGDAIGGVVTLVQDGGDSFFDTISLDASARAGDGGDQSGSAGDGGGGGSATGGAVTFTTTAGLLDASGIFTSATGFGGTGGQGGASGASAGGAGGDGTGGIVGMTLANADAPIALNSISLSTFASGGGGGNGAGTGGAGGSAQGGATEFTMLEGDVQSGGILLSTLAIGGGGGASDEQVSGDGGAGMAGDVTIALEAGTIQTTSFVADGRAFGGSGAVGSGSVNGNGGLGEGGSIGFNLDNAVLSADIIDLDAAGNGGIGVNGGAAVGGEVDFTVNGGSVQATNQIDLDGDAIGGAGDEGGAGGGASGGRVALTQNAGFISANLIFMNVSSTGGNTDATGVGGAAQGGSVEIRQAGGTMFASQALLLADATGASGGDGGDGLGGVASVEVGGLGTVQSPTLTISAFGQGGAAAPGSPAGSGGDGAGGDARLAVNGGTLTIGGSTTLTASGFGGGGVGEGAGGDAVGGVASFVQDGGAVQLDQIRLTAGGIGGSGGSQSGASDDNGGDGGIATGGAVTFTTTTGALEITNSLSADATGQGGAGGQGGSGGASTGGAGGDGAGGVVGLTFVNADTPIAIGFTEVTATAVGGTGGNGTSAGGAGGAAEGGNASLVINAEAAATDVLIRTNATGAAGGAGADGASARGGDATGGTTAMTLNGGTLTSGAVFVSAQAYGNGNGIVQGGVMRLDALGGNLTADFLSANTSAFGRSNAAQSITGGDTQLIVDNGSVLTLDQGAAVNAQALDLDSVPGITGGLRQGGTASANIVNGAVLFGGFFQVATSGSSGGSQSAGSGGQGGFSRIEIGSQGELRGSQLNMFADGRGGTVNGDDASASGGSGAGGIAQVTVNGGVLSLSEGAFMTASGFGGAGGTEGVGGAGTGGQALLQVNAGSAAVTGETNITASALGGSGSDGGDGAGGSALIDVGPTGALTTGSLVVDSSATGGAADGGTVGDASGGSVTVQASSPITILGAALINTLGDANFAMEGAGAFIADDLSLMAGDIFIDHATPAGAPTIDTRIASVSVNNLFAGPDSHIRATESLQIDLGGTLDADMLTGGSITANAGGAIAVGTATADEDLDLTSGGALALTQGSAGLNATIVAAGDAAIGALTAGDEIDVTAASLTGGSLTTTGPDDGEAGIVIATTGAIDLGSANSGAGFNATAGTSFSANTITAGESIAVNAGGTLSIAFASAELDVLLTGAAIDAANIEAGRDLLLDSELALTFSSYQAGRNLTLISDASVSGSTLDAEGAISVTGEGIELSGIFAAGGVALDAGAGALIVADALEAGVFEGGAPVDLIGGSIDVTATFGLEVNQAIATDGDIRIAAGGPLSITTGDASESIVLINGDGTAATADPDRSIVAGSLSAGDDLTVQAEGDFSVQTLDIGGNIMALAAGTITLAEPVSSEGALTLNAGGIAITGDVEATNDISLTARNAGLSLANVESVGGTVRLTSQDDLLVGDVRAAGSVYLTGMAAITAGDLTAGTGPLLPGSGGTGGGGGVDPAPTGIADGFDDFLVQRCDDCSTGSILLPFDINFFGVNYLQTFVSNNGYLTFESGQGTFTPSGLGASYFGQPIIAAFFADIDTGNPASAQVAYGDGTFAGRTAFGATWDGVGYFPSQADKLNSFQILLTDRSDTGAGNFDIYFNYTSITWETGSASGGTNGFGGSSAAVGYNAGTGNQPGTFFELPGSLVPGSFLNTGTMPLITGTNNGNPGQLVFSVRNGVVDPGPGAGPPSVFVNNIAEGNTGAISISDISADLAEVLGAGQVSVDEVVTVTDARLRAAGDLIVNDVSATGEDGAVLLTGGDPFSTDASTPFGDGDVRIAGDIFGSASVQIDGGGDVIVNGEGASVSGGAVAIRSGDDIVITPGNRVGGSDTAEVEMTAGALRFGAANAEGQGASAILVDGSVGGQAIALTSEDIEIGEDGSVSGDSVALTARTEGTSFVGGDDGDHGGSYSLDAAEIAAIGAPLLSIGSERDILLETMTLNGRSSDGDGLGRVEIEGGSLVGVQGEIRFTNANAETSIFLSANGGIATARPDDIPEDISARGAIVVLAPLGSISITDADGALTGELELSASAIAVAGESVIGALLDSETTAEREAILANNDGDTNEDGYIRAGLLSFDPRDGGFLFVQNSGPSDAIDDRAGFTAGSGGVFIAAEEGSQGPTEVIINGRVIGDDGSVATGAGVLALVQFEEGQATVAAESTVNGCLILGGNCGVLPPPEEPEIPVPPLDSGLVDQVSDGGEEGTTRSVSTVINLLEFEQSGEGPIIDDPVTGAGNEDLYLDPCPEDEADGICLTEPVADD